MDRRQEVLHRVLLEHIGGHAQVHCFIEKIFILVQGEQYQARGRELSAQGRDHLQPALPWHVDIQDRNRRVELADHPKRLLAISGLPNHSQRWIAVDHFTKPLAEDRVIIGDDD